MILAIEIATKLAVIVVICIATYYSYKIAKWTCARSVQWLTAGFVYILVWRLAFSVLQFTDNSVQLWVGQNHAYFIIPAYIMWAWGMYLLYITLRNLGRKK